LMKKQEKNIAVVHFKKKNCGGRTIRVESLDVHTAEIINRRVSVASKQHVVESHNSLL